MVEYQNTTLKITQENAAVFNGVKRIWHRSEREAHKGGGNTGAEN